MNSLSSGLIYGVTLYRNQPGFMNKISAQAGYALIALSAVVESAVALSFVALSLFILPFASAPFRAATEWLGSSVFSLGWAVTDFFLNPFVFVLVADERSARRILNTGDLTVLPPDAHVAMGR